MILGQLFLILLIPCRSVIGFPAFPVDSTENPKLPNLKVLDFLKKFGYIEEDDGNSEALYTEKGISDTIKIVQRFGAIEETGILDNATLKLMSSPRCGVPDIIRGKRTKRYTLANGWNKRTITYFLANWSPKLGEEAVAKNIQLALNAWGKYGHLTFRRSTTPDADIIVAFGSGYHGDRFPFDGSGNILAHAFFPYEMSSFGGDIHFDADENWTDRNHGGTEDGMDFSTVALHELGHSLGLAHSAVRTSVMFPYYKGYDPSTQFQLSYDDILAMYELYIRRVLSDDDDTRRATPGPDITTESASSTTDFSIPRYTTTGSEVSDVTPEFTPSTGFSTLDPPKSTTTPETTYEGDDETIDDHKKHDTTHHIPSTNSPSLPDICAGYFDAVATLREEIFIFKEKYVWRLREMSRIESGYPISIHQMFPSLPKNITHIDAAYERPDGMIVLFAGNEYWVYDGKQFIENSPAPLSDLGLPSTLEKIDAVQTWDRNGKTYFYKNDRFWRYNETAKEMDTGYPKHMERWRGVPFDLDAATTWKGVTYFFKSEFYWKFDNDWVIITEQSPLPAPHIWLGCPEDENSLLRFYGSDN